MGTEKKLASMLSNVISYIYYFFLNLPENIFENIKGNKSYINIIKSLNIVIINIGTNNINNARYKADKGTENFNILTIF